MTAVDIFSMTNQELSLYTEWEPWQGFSDRVPPGVHRIYEKHLQDPALQEALIWNCTQQQGSTTGQLKDGCLCTLTTHCEGLVHTKLLRPLYAPELLWCMGVPTFPRASSASGIPSWKFPVSNRAKMMMTGNGMHVPSVGLVILLVAVFVQRV